MNMKKRIEKLEQHIGTNEDDKLIIVRWIIAPGQKIASATHNETTYAKDEAESDAEFTARVQDEVARQPLGYGQKRHMVFVNYEGEAEAVP